MKFLQYIPILIFISLFGTCSYFAFFEPEPDYSGWIKTTCTIENFVWGRSGDAYLTYTVNWIDYEASSNRLQSKNFVKGDKFELRYNPHKQEEYIIHKHLPLFANGEKYDSTGASVYDISRGYFFDDDYNNTIIFKYKVKNKVYKRFQYFDKKNPFFNQIKVGDSIRIYYWLENPQRSMLVVGSR